MAISGDSTSVMAPMTSKLSAVIAVEMKNLVRNMKKLAMPSTKLNLAAFFRIKMKELRAEEQKLSPSYIPLFIVFLQSYMIASVFIAIFDVSANTILQCYLLDKEVAAQQGLADPDHIPETMNKFF